MIIKMWSGILSKTNIIFQKSGTESLVFLIDVHESYTLTIENLYIKKIYFIDFIIIP